MANQKPSAGDIVRQFNKDDRNGLVVFRERGETKVKCAGCVTSESDVAYMVAGLLCQMAPTFNITPISFAAIVVDALNAFFTIELQKKED